MTVFEALQLAYEGKTVLGGVTFFTQLSYDKKERCFYYGERKVDPTINRITIQDAITLAGISNMKWKTINRLYEKLSMTEMLQKLKESPNNFAIPSTLDINNAEMQRTELLRCIHGCNVTNALEYNKILTVLNVGQTYDIYDVRDFPRLFLTK
jgi:hypothetical protein